jgi:chemotaxis signal transduction protein
VTSESQFQSNTVSRIRLLQVSSITLGVPEEQVLTLTEWNEPTPLPFAPKSVFGVASIQGRMFTVVDVGLILDAETSLHGDRMIVALNGDEQLALAVNSAKESIEIDESQVTSEGESTLIRGRVQLDGKDVLLLDVDALFAGVIRGKERRRRRL